MNVDASSDILNGGERSIVEGTGPINGTADGCDFVKTADDLKLGVICDEECSVDGDELGEGEICQGGTVYEGDGTSDRCQVLSRDCT